MHKWAALKAIAIATWLACGVPPILAIATGRFGGRGAVGWIAAFVLFGLALLASLYRRHVLAARRYWLDPVLLATQSVAGIVVSCLTIAYLNGVGTTVTLLVIVAAQLPAFVSVQRAAVWVLTQSVIFVTCAASLAGTAEALTFGVAFLLFQALALGAAIVTERLASTNAELRATRALLAEQSRNEERLRMARDLHDTLGHHLVAMSIQLDLACRRATGEAAEHARVAHEISRELLADVREVVSKTRKSSSFDLSRAVQRFASRQGDLQVHIELTGSEANEDTPESHAILRAVQEIITNSSRHSGARNLWIDLDIDVAGYDLRARDDGRGSVAVSWGNGLSGMRERFEGLAGRLEVSTAPGNGFEVRGFIPRGPRQ